MVGVKAVNNLIIAKWLLFLGSVNALLCVVLGAFGAHVLKARLAPETLSVYQTGVQYHFYHALGLLLLGVAALHLPSSGYVRWSGGFMLFGILVFSGSLYALSIGGIRWLGAITPIGGAAFIVAWLVFAIGILKTRL